MNCAMSRLIRIGLLVLLVMMMGCHGRRLKKRRVFPQICLSTSDCTGLNQVCVRAFSGYGHCVSRTDMPNPPNMDEHEKDDTYVKIDEGFVEGLGEPVVSDDPDQPPSRRKRANGIEHDVDDAGPPSHRKRNLNFKKKRSLGINSEELAASFSNMLQKDSTGFYRDLDVAIDKLEHLIKVDSRIPLPGRTIRFQEDEGADDINTHIDVNVVRKLPAVSSRDTDVADDLRQFFDDMDRLKDQIVNRDEQEPRWSDYKPESVNRQLPAVGSIQITGSRNQQASGSHNAGTPSGFENEQVTGFRDKQEPDSDNNETPVGFENDQEEEGFRDKQAPDSENDETPDGFENDQEEEGFRDKQAPSSKHAAEPGFDNKPTQGSVNRQAPGSHKMKSPVTSGTELDQKIEATTAAKTLTASIPDSVIITGHHPGLEKMSKNNVGQLKATIKKNEKDNRLRYTGRKRGHGSTGGTIRGKGDTKKAESVGETSKEKDFTKGQLTADVHEKNEDHSKESRRKSGTDVRLNMKHKLSRNQYKLHKTANHVNERGYKVTKKEYSGSIETDLRGNSREFDDTNIEKEISRQKPKLEVLELKKEHKSRGSGRNGTNKLVQNSENIKGKSTIHRYKLDKIAGRKTNYGRKVTEHSRIVEEQKTDEIEDNIYEQRVGRTKWDALENGIGGEGDQAIRSASKTSISRTAAGQDSEEDESLDDSSGRGSDPTERAEEENERHRGDVTEGVHRTAEEREETGREAESSGRPGSSIENVDMAEELELAEEFEKNYRFNELAGKTVEDDFSPAGDGEQRDVEYGTEYEDSPGMGGTAGNNNNMYSLEDDGDDDDFDRMGTSEEKNKIIAIIQEQ
ncbi:uncharacterized protein LOC121375716 isoform X2 [Gigantopelta aegis]|uniref:uncharacterized protein LOC121375716 isoform X2 n=1 Tax=Gigantopelta aegis TaxID=1735272 RepID=UPI001B887716|nr:uncharacterized protein LOC121375716 isoform X2 [Gigantopelta aegis]